MAQSLPNVKNLDIQPFKAQIKRLIQARDFLGEPFTEATKSKIELAFNLKNEDEAIIQVQQIIDLQCLIDIQINPESRVKVEEGPVNPVLIENGWRNYLVKIRNEAVIQHLLV